MFDQKAIREFRGENFEYSASRPTNRLLIGQSPPTQILRTEMASSPSVPRPGPARLTTRAGLDEWLSEAKQCKYLPEWAMKQLCEMVKECLMEGEYSIKVLAMRHSDVM
jgi:hypothetical protein